MVAGVRGLEKSAPNFGLCSVRPGRDPVNPFIGHLADLARIRWRKARPAGQSMRVVTRNDSDRTGFERHRSNSVDFDDQLARANVMIADELLGHREEGLEMAGREFRGDAEV